MKTMKKLMAMLLAGSLVLSMAACNSGTNETSSPAGGEDANNGEITKLVIGGVTGNAANDLLLAHQEELKEEIGVEIDFSVTTFEEYQQKLLTLASANSSELDLCFVEASCTATLANGGVLEPLDSYFEKSETASWDKYIPNVVETSGTVDGVRYAVPHTLDCRCAIYDKNILEELGYDKAPETVDEFIVYCQKAKEAGYIPLALRYSLYWTPMYEWGVFLFGEGGSFVKQADDGSWEANLDNETGEKWIDIVRQISSTVKGDQLVNMGDADVYAAFDQGIAGCTFSGNWFYNEVAPETTERLISAPLPAGSTGTTGSPMGGWRLGIFKNSKNKDAAFKLIEWMQDGENAAQCVDGLPGVIDAYNYVDEDLKDLYQIYGDEMSERGTTITPPDFEYALQVANALISPFQDAILNQNTSSSDAAKACDEAIQRAIDENA